MPTEVKEMSKSEIIDKLTAVPYYNGVMGLDMNVIPLWNIGVEKVSLETFLEGARKYNERRNEKGTLNIPLLVPFGYSDATGEVIRERYLKALEEEYPVHCVIRNCSVEEVIRHHFEHETEK